MPVIDITNLYIGSYTLNDMIRRNFVYLNEFDSSHFNGILMFVGLGENVSLDEVEFLKPLYRVSVLYTKKGLKVANEINFAYSDLTEIDEKLFTEVVKIDKPDGVSEFYTNYEIDVAVLLETIMVSIFHKTGVKYTKCKVIKDDDTATFIFA